MDRLASMVDRRTFGKLLEKEQQRIEIEQEAGELLPRVLERFIQKFSLTAEQSDKFVQYFELLQASNQEFNLTAKTTPSGVFNHLFADSLALLPYINWKDVGCIADVGTGAGFPGLPLKIMQPHLELKLIEVNKKKQIFLQEICQKLGLDNVEIIDMDWRTFNRKTADNIDFFVTKATFDDEEIVRMFRQNCGYTDKFLIYWASSLWQPHPRCANFIQKIIEYKNGTRQAKFVFFGQKENSQIAHFTKK